jgi:C1A family cysteine protease
LKTGGFVGQTYFFGQTPLSGRRKFVVASTDKFVQLVKIMKIYYRRLFSTVCLLTIFFCALNVNSQDNWVDVLFVMERCLEQNISTRRTYTFQGRPILKAYAPKPWYYGLKKIIPFWNDGPDEKYTSDAIHNLETGYGLTAPLGEGENSKNIRLAVEKQLRQQQLEGEAKWNEWLKSNPKPSAEEKKQAEFRFRFQGLAAEKLPAFDWRTAGLDAGESVYQGDGCNSCWAFAAVDAMRMSRQLNARRAAKLLASDAPAPNVRQLLSCMVKAENYCDDKKPDEAFTFMVDKGLPLGGSSQYNLWRGNLDTNGWSCDATDSVKAQTWDYVSPAPQTVAAPELIKRAVITYGAVVAMVNFDNCLSIYASGVFNEEQFQDGSHMILIIGWDDTKSAWLVKNSYGTAWGEKGFGWIKYGSNNIGQFAAFVFADPKVEERFLR